MDKDESMKNAFDDIYIQAVLELPALTNIERIADELLDSEATFLKRELIECGLDNIHPRLQAVYHRRLDILEAEQNRRWVIDQYRGKWRTNSPLLPPEYIASLLDLVDIISVIFHDIPQNARGRIPHIQFHCPFHDDRVPSGHVYTDDHPQRWWCFACNFGGTAIDWVMKKHNIGFRQAVEELAAEYNYPLPVKNKGDKGVLWNTQ